MDITAGTKATAVAATAVMTVGIGIILYGIVRNDLARSLGGACLTMTALTLLALIAIRRWTTDTQVERRQLADSTRAAEVEHTRYIAAQAALELERGRVLRDARTERDRMEVQIKAAHAAMRERFEQDRAKLICDTMETTVQLFRTGAFDPLPAEHARGQVIDFPHQAAPEGQRVREH